MDAFWLADSEPQDVLDLHRISNRLEKGSTFLEIGIGRGRTITTALERGCTVYAVDVSRRALENCPPAAKRISVEYFSLLEERLVDTALAHLVMQHCSDHDVCALLHCAVNTLRDEGLLSVQFAEGLAGSAERHADSVRTGFLHLRTFDYCRRLIERAGGEVLEVLEPVEWTNDCIRWHVFHVGRADRGF